MSSKIEAGARAIIEYEHRKGDKLISKGYSYGDWLDFTHMVQEYPNMKMVENIFDTAGNLIATNSYKGFSFLRAKLIEKIIKKRIDSSTVI